MNPKHGRHFEAPTIWPSHDTETKTVNHCEGRETLNTRVLLATAELGHVGRSVGTVTSQQPCYSSDDVIKNGPKRLKQDKHSPNVQFRGFN